MCRNPNLSADTSLPGCDICSRSLADINECANKTVCGEHAFCQNLIGTYQCMCDQGYEATGDGRGCVGGCPSGADPRSVFFLIQGPPQYLMGTIPMAKSEQCGHTAAQRLMVTRARTDSDFAKYKLFAEPLLFSFFPVTCENGFCT